MRGYPNTKALLGLDEFVVELTDTLCQIVREKLDFHFGCLKLEQSLAADPLVGIQNPNHYLLDLPSHQPLSAGFAFLSSDPVRAGLQGCVDGSSGEISLWGDLVKGYLFGMVFVATMACGYHLIIDGDNRPDLRDPFRIRRIAFLKLSNSRLH